ncbi:MAG: hypothetical protein QXW78_00195 [Candidatus Thermoplasmatota archaeon]
MKKKSVAVTKALHLLAPNFFPLWDEKIAKAYECCYNNPGEKYFLFCEKIKEIAEEVKNYVNSKNKSLFKLID